MGSTFWLRKCIKIHVEHQEVLFNYWFLLFVYHVSCLVRKWQSYNGFKSLWAYIIAGRLIG